MNASIDNSVVRPAEQAAYSSAGGLARRLQDELSKLQGQGPLSTETRRDLLTAIETIEQQLQGINTRTIDFYNGEATKFSLDHNSTRFSYLSSQRGLPLVWYLLQTELKKYWLSPAAISRPSRMMCTYRK